MAIKCIVCKEAYAKAHIIEASEDVESGPTCKHCDLKSKFVSVLDEVIELRVRVAELEQGKIRIETIKNDERMAREIDDFVRNTTHATISNDSVIPNNVNVEFTMVRNGFRPKAIPSLTIPLVNQFDPLVDPILEDSERETEEHSEPESLLIGDSIVKFQKGFISKRPNIRRSLKCFPGARTDKIFKEVDRIIKENRISRSLFIVHAGVNDLPSTHYDVIRRNLKNIIETIKVSRNKVIISGILPKLNTNKYKVHRLLEVNNIMRNICNEEGVEFVNFYDHFVDSPHFYAKDGLHLNRRGSDLLGRLFDKAVNDHCSIGSLPFSGNEMHSQNLFMV